MSRVRSVLIPVSVGIAVLSAGASRAQEVPKEREQQESRESPQSVAPEDQREVAIPYIPPAPERPAPEVRAAGLTRGPAAPASIVTLLVPEHVGLTVQPAPVLYWHASEPTSVRIEITLIDEESVKPLLEFPVEGPVLAGTHSVRLADHDIRLQPDQLYEWSVTMVETPGRRGAADRVAKGFVQRVAASEELRKQLESVKDPERAAVYARHGIWYDALADLSEQLATDPSDQQAGRLRAALLVQVGLSGLDSEALRAPAKQEP